MSWYTDSYAWIQQQQAEHPGLNRAELRKYCSANYPYDMRSGWAYKSWLRAMNTFFGKQKAGKRHNQIELPMAIGSEDS